MNNAELMNEYTQHYSNIVSLTYLTVDSLKDTQNGMEAVCGNLANKLMLHAATIDYLCNGTIVNFPGWEKDSFIFDHSSIATLARAILDGYLTLYEVFFESIPGDERDYRYFVYLVRGLKLREEIQPKNPDPQSKAEIDRKISELRDIRSKIESTQHYSKLQETKEQPEQSSSLNGQIYPRRKFKKRAIAANIAYELAHQSYALHSGHVHSDSLSALQGRKPIVSQSNITLSKMMVIACLSNIIVNFCKTYESAHSIPEKYSDWYRIAEEMVILFQPSQI